MSYNLIHVHNQKKENEENVLQDQQFLSLAKVEFQKIKQV
jgi:hypothetical protein